MYNFYEFFNINYNASNKDIVTAYKQYILVYNNYNKLSKKQKYEIKMLKIGLYILTNKKLRKKYNKLIYLQNKQNKFNKPNNEFNKPNNQLNKLYNEFNNEINNGLYNEFNNEINNELYNELNNEINNEFNLDYLFNIDNSWMKNIKLNNDSNKKHRIESQVIGDRIFSIPLNTK